MTATHRILTRWTLFGVRAVSRRMTPAAWKRLHTLGMWVIAAVFGYSFFKRIPTISVLYAIPFSILCAAIAVRLVGKWAQANKRRDAHLRNTLPYPLESIS